VRMSESEKNGVGGKDRLAREGTEGRGECSRARERVWVTRGRAGGGKKGQTDRERQHGFKGWARIGAGRHRDVSRSECQVAEEGSG
jgi:hypothetical protein